MIFLLIFISLLHHESIKEIRSSTLPTVTSVTGGEAFVGGRCFFMKEIKLTQGKVALVDDEDFEKVTQFKWTATLVDKNWYAVRTYKGKHILLHRFIMNAQKGQLVDHKDRDGLNCQKINMRFCSKSQNQMNQKSHGGISKYKGVWFRRDTLKWSAEIRANKKRICLGSFITEVEAALAYNEAAKKYHGEFANPNQI